MLQAHSEIAAPYPCSNVVTGITWAAPSTVIRLGQGSDNWPITWADDDFLYTAYGDDWGFQPKVSKKLSLGFAKVFGDPPNLSGQNLRSSGNNLEMEKVVEKQAGY